MILDILENAHRYFALGSRFEKAFEFLLRPDLKNLAAGRYEIDEPRCFAMVSREPGRKREDARLETHRKYIDIQMVLEGTDTMGWKPAALCRSAAAAYDPDSDLQFFADPPDAWLAVKGGAFAVFFPEDAHMPLISPGQIHKVVVKIDAAPAHRS